MTPLVVYLVYRMKKGWVSLQILSFFKQNDYITAKRRKIS